MSFPRYPKYKTSGLDWLGDVPEHWSIIPLKFVAEFINGAAFKPTDWRDSGVPIIRIENLNGSNDFNYFDGALQERYLVRDGDLLFGWSGNRGTSFGPFLWKHEQVCALNQHIFRVVPNEVSTSVLYWMLRAVTAHIEEQAHGIIGMVHVTKGELGSIKMPLPPREEGERIANFLLVETQRIDSLIAEQRRLIELLKEKRQAVISHAVTKGLNPHAQMKASGVECIGDIPTHWIVGALKQFCDLITDGAHVSPDTEDGVFPFVSTRDIEDGSINFDDALRTSVQSYEYLVRNGCRPAKGDVLFSKDGTIGKTIVIGEEREFVVASSLIIMRPKHTSLTANFLHYACMSRGVVLQVDAFVKGAGLPRLSIQNLRRIAAALPPLGEQHEIVEALQHDLAAFDALMEEGVRAITLLQERRSALISAAVTGKIDVRLLTDAEAA